MSRKVGKYVITRKIGAGSFSKVYLGVHKNTKAKVAIKRISKKAISDMPGSMARVRIEIGIHKLMDHPNIITLYDVYEDDDYIYIILEYAKNGELFGYINQVSYLSRPQILKFFQQMIYAIEYCAELMISHRDIKPENILLDKYNNIKIGDFGLAKVMGDTPFLSSHCGSPHYIAPEILANKEYDGNKCVVWSAGVILYAMLCGQLPFDDTRHKRLFAKITRGEYVLPKSLSKIEADIITRLLTVDPDERIPLAEIKMHPYFRQNFPPTYIPPRPVNYIELLSYPMKNVDKSVIRDLVIMQSGVYDDKLAARILKDLESEGPSFRKVFYYLYLKRTEGYGHKEKLTRENSKHGDDIFDLPVVKTPKGEQKKRRRRSVLISSGKVESPNITSQSLRDHVAMSRDVSSIDLRAGVATKNPIRWFKVFFTRRNKSSRPSAMELERRHQQITSLLENGDYEFDVTTEKDKVITQTTLSLLEVAEKIQIALDLNSNSKWTYPDPSHFIVDIPDDVNYEIKIESLPTAFMNDIHQYSKWGTEDVLAPGTKKKNLWFFYKRRNRAGRSADTSDSGPNLNEVSFQWTGGSSKSFIEEVVNCLKVINIRD